CEYFFIGVYVFLYFYIIIRAIEEKNYCEEELKNYMENILTRIDKIKAKLEDAQISNTWAIERLQWEKNNLEKVRDRARNTALSLGFPLDIWPHHWPDP
ncbi:hypothetical protein AAMO2058_001630200, partial [Amorphochlora amoebiformis]